ncbi:S8 family peptidase [Candidatus Microgenomates bacterium]|nr:S8 family peptidase [Candidatus Microgenomates bacterium]
MKFRVYYFLFLIFSLFFLLPSPIFAKPSQPFAPDKILVKFRENTPDVIKEKFQKQFETKIKDKISRLDVEVMQISRKNLTDLVNQFLLLPFIEYAEPDFVATTMDVPNDPYFNLNLQWGMQKVKAPDAWKISTSNPGVKIAILDTGIDRDHEDLSSKITDNWNCTDSPLDDDSYGHGTHVAGIAAAATNNGTGVAGLGYNASLMNVKVLGDDGSGYYSWIANCITWAADNGAKVINMSLGGPSKSKTLENAVNYAWQKGAVIVAAAGNSGNSSPTYPAYYTNVIAVAATDSNDKKASWSSYGRWVDVAAPGVDIYSTFPNHPYTIGKKLGYDYGSGTSMATPHVSGLAALVWSSSFGTSNANVRKRIESKADKISGSIMYWTYGRINALKAVSP